MNDLKVGNLYIAHFLKSLGLPAPHPQIEGILGALFGVVELIEGIEVIHSSPMGIVKRKPIFVSYPDTCQIFNYDEYCESNMRTVVAENRSLALFWGIVDFLKWYENYCSYSTRKRQVIEQTLKELYTKMGFKSLANHEEIVNFIDDKIEDPIDYNESDIKYAFQLFIESNHITTK